MRVATKKRANPDKIHCMFTVCQQLTLDGRGFFLHGHRYRKEVLAEKQRKANTDSKMDMMTRGTHKTTMVS